MIELLKAIFSPKPTHRDVWRIAFWKDEEITDLLPIFKSIFSSPELDRDYENEWEWIEGTNKDGIYVNAARPHDWEKGKYEKPVLVLLKKNERAIGEKALIEWAHQLSKAISDTVFVGKMSDDEDNGFRKVHEIKNY